MDAGEGGCGSSTPASVAAVTVAHGNEPSDPALAKVVGTGDVGKLEYLAALAGVATGLSAAIDRVGPGAGGITQPHDLRWRAGHRIDQCADILGVGS